MADIWTKEKRSYVMSRILATDTKPELLVRKMLYGAGFRYRVHSKKLPGKPDIVISRLKTVIFVHGCFWHLHSSCRDGAIPKTRVAYWTEKLLKNKDRDARNIKELRKQGWRVLRIWECEVEKKPSKVTAKIKKFLLKKELLPK